MRSSNSRPIYYLNSPFSSTFVANHKLVQYKGPKSGNLMRSSSTYSKKMANTGSELRMKREEANLDLENERHLQDVNYKLFLSIELKLRKSEVFNQLFSSFMDHYRMFEIHEFNRKIEESRFGNQESKVDIYRKFDLFSNNMVDKQMEFVCFEKMVKPRQVTILDFIREDPKALRELKNTLKIDLADWEEFRKKYFIGFGDLKTLLQLKGIILKKLKPTTIASRENILRPSSNDVQMANSKLPIKCIKFPCENLQTHILLKKVNKEKAGASSLAKLLERMKTEMGKKKEFATIQNNVKDIIAITHKLKTLSNEPIEAKLRTQDANEKYQRLNFIKKIVKMNLILYLMLQINNKRGFIKLGNELNFI